MRALTEDPPDSGEQAYAYAKACGIISKSFVGKKISALKSLRLLSELERLLFPETHHELPDREILIDMERRIEKRAVEHVLAIVRCFTEPPELLIRQLRAYEYSDLKTCLHYIADGIKTLPLLCDIGRFRTIHFDSFPDLAAMLRGTGLKSIFSEDLKSLQPNSTDFASIEIKLDTCYYIGLLESLAYLPNDDCAVVERILTDEISLRNCIWALRLRTYYRKTAAETNGYLMNIKMHTDLTKNLVSDAYRSLDLPLDSRVSWHGWKWEKFINLEKPGERWEMDPRYFQNAASKYLYHLALRYFHHTPMAISTIFCFIKIKQFEEELLTSIAEGLGMGMTSKDVFDLIEVPV